MSEPKALVFGVKNTTASMDGGFLRPASNYAMTTIDKPNSHSTLSVIDQFDNRLSNLETKAISIIKSSNTTGEAILNRAKMSSLEESGELINSVIITSKKLNPADLKEGGIVSRVFKFGAAKKEEFFAQHRTVKEQIKQISVEVEKQKNLLASHVVALKSIYNENIEQIREFDALIIKCRAEYSSMSSQILEMESEIVDNEFDNEQLAIIQAAKSTLNRLEKKMTTWETAKTQCVMAAPQIRIMQDGATALIDIFDEVVSIIIPSWERDFSRRIIQIEQDRTIKVIKTIKAGANEIMRQNADGFHRNAVATAEISQGQMIEIDTLKYVQDKFVQTLNDVKTATANESEKRKLAFHQAELIQNDMKRIMSS